jgi:hypothetical protein
LAISEIYPPGEGTVLQDHRGTVGPDDVPDEFDGPADVGVSLSSGWGMGAGSALRTRSAVQSL